MTRTVEPRRERRNVKNLVITQSDDSTLLWRCNHGVSVYHSLDGKNISYKCLCPQSYYMVIDESKDHREINSYHQYTSVLNQNCE